MDADLARLVHTATMTALESCTDVQRDAWLTTTGTPQDYDDEPSPPVPVSEYAASLGIKRQTAHDRILLAEVRVWRQVSRELLREFGLLLADMRDVDAASVAEEACSVSMLDPEMASQTMVRYGTRTEQRINLGPGSQAMERVEKHTAGAATDARRVAAHRRWAKPQSSD